MHSLRILFAMTALGPLVALAADPAAPTTVAAHAAGTVVAAHWVEKEANFPYKGLTTSYTCTGIEGKVSSILRLLGMRPGFKVLARSCIRDVDPGRLTPGIEPMPWVYIKLQVAEPYAPEMVNQLSSPGAAAELAKPGEQGKPATDAAKAPGEPFSAHWQQVRLRGSPMGLIQQGDCELIDQMAHDVFPQIGVRVLENGMNCVPKQVNPGSVQLLVEVLQPVKTASTGARQ